MSTKLRAVSLLGFVLALAGCTILAGDPSALTSPRDAMRSWIIDLSITAKTRSPGFLLVAQNGEELITLGDRADAPLAIDYLAALDGLGREDLFFGYTEDGEPTPRAATARMLSYLDRAANEGVCVLTIDYCWTPQNVRASYAENAAHGFVSFAAPDRALDAIPTVDSFPIEQNDASVTQLAEVRNFLYLINPQQYADTQAFVSALAAVDVDLLIVDAESEEGPLSAGDVGRLKWKSNGARRLVLCYLSIGEAEDYRDYWNPHWAEDPPDWLLYENPAWPGNYTVRYWDPLWKAMVDAQLDRILAAGFDGVYLDCVDVYERFEG